MSGLAQDLKILVIGLDGASPEKLFHWMDRGELPILGAMKQRGCSGRLESVLPAYSALAWPAFYTGVNPGDLGQFAVDIFENPRDYKLLDYINAGCVNQPAFWHLLSDSGKRVGIVNIPMTYPPQPVNGFLITGFLTPPSSNNFTYPPSLASILSDYQIDIRFEKYSDIPDAEVDKREILNLQYVVSKKRFETCQQLVQQFRPDFFIVNFKGLDNVQHLFWGNDTIVLEFLQYLDDIVAKLKHTMEPDYTIIMSDHGFHKAGSHYFYVNAWLEKQGYLMRKRSPKSVLTTFLFRFGVWLAERSNLIRRIIPVKFKQFARTRGPSEQIDFGRSIAYASKYGVFLNKDLLGKMGTIEAVKEKIAKELRHLLAPTGGALVQEIHTIESLYSGIYTKNMPDLIFLLNEDFTAVPTLRYPLFSRRIDRPFLQGEHGKAQHGIFMMEGNGIRRGHIERPRIIDIAPTILHIMDVPLSAEFDGEVLFSCFEEDSLLRRKQKIQHYAKRTPSERPPLTDEEQEQIRKRLKALGYI